MQTSPIAGLELTRESGQSDNEVKIILENESCFWLGSRSGLTRIDKAAVDGWF